MPTSFSVRQASCRLPSLSRLSPRRSSALGASGAAGAPLATVEDLRAERAAWRRWFERDARARPEGTGGEQLLETRELVRSLLARVDLETQRAVVHYWVDGMTLEEVAALVGRSVPTVRKRLEGFAALTNEELRVP